MRYIHRQQGWPKSQMDNDKLLSPVGRARLRQGGLLGGMNGLGLQTQQKANLENLVAEVIKSSAIEGTVFRRAPSYRRASSGLLTSGSQPAPRPTAR